MKPPVFNHKQYTNLEADYMILKVENEQLQVDSKRLQVSCKLVPRLQAENERLKSERDAAVECLSVLEPCEFCMYYDENCICARPLDCGNCFEWRGLKESEKGEAT